MQASVIIQEINKGNATQLETEVVEIREMDEVSRQLMILDSVFSEAGSLKRGGESQSWESP